MSSPPNRCDGLELVSVHAVHALPEGEALALEAHVADCPECREELARLRATVDCFASWPTDLLRPSVSLWQRMASRIAEDTGELPRVEPVSRWVEPDWEEEVRPGLACKLLATDAENDRVTMLVRLAAGSAYPSHCHTGLEELYLLAGELWVDHQRLHPGDYIKAEPGTVDDRVWTETGCTCVLITSPRDVLL